MKITRCSDPWEHFFVEEFLSDEELLLALELVKDVNSLPYQRQVLTIQNYILVDKFKLLLKELNINLTERYKIHLEINTVGVDYEYQIHTDLPEKVFSFVLQLSEKGNGTRLYSKEKIFKDTTLLKNIDPDKTIPWGVNSGVGFFRGDHTYHSFDNLYQDKCRKSITFILVDNF